MRAPDIAALALLAGCSPGIAGPGEATPTEVSGGGPLIGEWVQLLDDGTSLTSSWASPDSVGTPGTNTISESGGVITITSGTDGTAGDGATEHATFIDYTLTDLIDLSLGSGNELSGALTTYWTKYRIEMELRAIQKTGDTTNNHLVFMSVGDYTGAEWIGGAGAFFGSPTFHNVYPYYQHETFAGGPGSPANDATGLRAVIYPEPNGSNAFSGTRGLGTVIVTAFSSGGAENTLAELITDAFDGAGDMRFRLGVTRLTTASDALDVDFEAWIRWVQHTDGTELEI